MADQDTPTRSSNMEKAEGDREDAPDAQYQKGGGSGITNRPLDEEIKNQDDLPARGDSKPGAHAG